MSFYSPPSPRSMPDDPLSLTPVTPTGPPPPLSRALSQGHNRGASSYYTPPPNSSSSLAPGMGPSASSFAPAPSMPQIQMPSFPVAQPTAPDVGGFTAPVSPSMPQVQVQPRTSACYTFVPTNEADSRSLDQRLPASKYVRECTIIEKDTQQCLYTVTTEHKRRETRVRNASGTEVALFSWSAVFATRVKVQGEKEVKGREWMSTHTSAHYRGRLIRHKLRPFVWIMRGDVDIIESPSRPGVPLAIIKRDEHNRIELEAFHEALNSLPDLLQTFILATIYMRVEES